ncbi:efflux RND transporter periplasmic adaptor subunit [Formicincola oecophyllae]|uniref:Efflux RND transporter periplasmic adaptor subunit n=2 Tax=Formicincola oecophyllae TaxID=2558361 RepID=A0A4Y6UCY8_9PROT|nr:efflux RND transporter periplasmic adaptor subunit [Formicincola oecophyllae]
MAGLAAWGITQRLVHYGLLTKETHQNAITPVVLISPHKGPATRSVDLPANLAAWYEAPIYAQVSGYVKAWYTDYGARVKKGEVLALISTPSLDAQFAAAKAHYDVVLARYHLALITAARWNALKGTQAVSRQEVDVQAANAAAEKASLEAASHEVERFQALENFKRIVAPFDGIVTARFVNIGDYVSDNGGSLNTHGGSGALFSVADISKMRVFVSVPQDYAAAISPQISAELTVPQYPGRKFHANFLATARAFNAATRTVTTELWLENKDDALWPNSYATAHIVAPSDPNILLLPTSSLIFRGYGMQVAMVKNNRAVIHNVTVGTDLGLESQIITGLKPGDKVIANPVADLLDGDKVRLVKPTRGYNAPAVLPKPVPMPAAPATDPAAELRRLAAEPTSMTEALPDKPPPSQATKGATAPSSAPSSAKQKGGLPSPASTKAKAAQTTKGGATKGGRHAAAPVLPHQKGLVPSPTESLKAEGLSGAGKPGHGAAQVKPSPSAP